MTEHRSPEEQEPIDEGDEGSADRSAEPHFLIIGRILRPHGVAGDVRVEIHTHLPERFTWLERVHYARDPNETAPKIAPIENVRFHKGQVLLKLSGVDDRDEADLLRGYWLLVPREDAVPLEEDEFFLFELEGLKVYTEDGEYLGVVTEILETGANEVFVIQGDQGELLLPNIEESIVEVDVEGGRMVVHLLPGLR